MGLHHPAVPRALHGTSFVAYFWAIRAMHAPLFVLADIAAGLPPVRAVHAISTGYAGLLGAMIRLRRNIPFVLTEHGIYTKERKIDLAQATWIQDHNDDVCNTLHDEMGYIRGLWIRFYEQIGRMAYAQASPIVSLYEGNRLRQIADGAAAEKRSSLPTGSICSATGLRLKNGLKNSAGAGIDRACGAHQGHQDIYSDIAHAGQ